jgi:hypothetical protein
VPYDLTVDPSTIAHTRPFGFHGVARHLVVRSQDNAEEGYRSKIRSLRPEHIRIHMRAWGTVEGANYLDTLRPWAKNIRDATGCQILLQMFGRPADTTSTTDPQAQDPNNIAPNGSGFSPNDHAQEIQRWRNAGVPPALVESTNEFVNATAGGQYFGTDKDRAETWQAMADRLYAAAAHGVDPAIIYMLGVATEVRTSGNGSDPFYTIDGFLQRGLRRTDLWPWPNTNVQNRHFERDCYHAYGKPEGHSGASVTQLQINSIGYDPGPIPEGRRCLQVTKNVRARLNALGFSSCGIAITETAIDEGDMSFATYGTDSALFDCVAMQEALELHRTHGLEMCTLHSIIPRPVNSFFSTEGSPWTLAIRGTVYRDMIRRFFEGNFDCPAWTLTGSGLTAGTNGIRRIRVAVILNPARTKMFLWVTNASTTTADTLDYNLGVAPTGASERIALSPSLGETDSPAVTTPTIGQTGTLNVPAGTSWVYVIPIAGTPPPPPPPPPTFTGRVGPWSSLSAVQANEEPDPPPTAFTGRVGPWSALTGVVTSGGAPPAPTPTPTEPKIVVPSWRMVLTDRQGHGRGFLEPPEPITWTRRLTGASEVNLKVDTFAEIARDLDVGAQRAIKLYRNETLRFYGFVTEPLRRTADAHEVKAVDPYARFAARVIRKHAEYGVEGTPNQDLSDAGVIMRTLVEHENTREHTGLRIVTVPRSVDRQRIYDPGKVVGEAIDELSEGDDGFYFRVDPVDDDPVVMGDLVVLWPTPGQDRPRAKFEYGDGTLANIEEPTIDETLPVNSILAEGADGITVLVQDQASIAERGLWERYVAFSDITDKPTLRELATDTLRMSTQGVSTYTIKPIARGESFVPGLLEDFDVGDTVYLRIAHGALDVDAAVTVLEATLTIEALSGREQLTSLVVS